MPVPVRAAMRRRLGEVVPVGAGMFLLGFSAYVVLGLAGHALSPRDYAAVASLYLLAAITGPGIFIAIEQETNREVSGRRLTGVGTRPVRRAGLLIGAAFALAVAVALTALSPLLVPRVLGGYWGLHVAAVVAIAGASAVYLLRGLFAGERRFGWYASSLGLEGLARIVPCVALAVLGVTDPLWYGWAFALGTGLAALLCLPGLPAAQPGPAVDVPRMARNSGLLALASGLTYLIANTAPLVLTARLPVEPEVAASFVSLFVLARIPVFLFAPLQAFLLPTFTAGVERVDVAHLRSRLRIALLAVAALGLPSALLTAALGPWAARVFLGAPLELSHLAAGLLGCGTVAMLAAQTLQPVLVALRVHRMATGAWTAGAVVFAVLLFLPGDPVVGAIAAQVGAPVTVFAVMAVAIVTGMRRLSATQPAPA